MVTVDGIVSDRVRTKGLLYKFDMSLVSSLSNEYIYSRHRTCRMKLDQDLGLDKV